MAFYLDPKNDVTFKKVFGQHKNVLISFLNALLPLKENQLIEQVEYLNNEMLPAIPELKSTIVDIRCKDNHGRQFIVEMQLIWTDSFFSRVLFNACKSFSNQINRGDPYKILYPVYSLNIINDAFSKQSAVWYHHYTLAHQSIFGYKTDGISFVFIEMPNFIPANITERRATVLWLRFLKEIENNTTMVDKELLEIPEIAEAVEALKVTSYSKEELEKYDKYWDIVSQQKSFLVDAYQEGKLEGKQEGRQEGRQEGKQEGKLEERTEANRQFTITLLKETEFSDEKIAMLVGVEVNWVREIRKQVEK